MKARIVRSGAVGSGGEHKIGSCLEGKHAWIHCMPRTGNLPALAEPADEECEARVKRATAERVDGLAGYVATLANPPDSLLENGDSMREFRQMCRNYGIYNGELDEFIALSDSPDIIVVDERPEEDGN